MTDPTAPDLSLEQLEELQACVSSVGAVLIGDPKATAIISLARRALATQSEHPGVGTPKTAAALDSVGDLGRSGSIPLAGTTAPDLTLEDLNELRRRYADFSGRPSLLEMVQPMYWARAYAASDVLNAFPRLLAMAKRTSEAERITNAFLEAEQNRRDLGLTDEPGYLRRIAELERRLAEAEKDLERARVDLVNLLRIHDSASLDEALTLNEQHEVAQTLRIAELESLLAEQTKRTAEAEQRLLAAIHDSPDGTALSAMNIAVERIADLERRLAEAKALILTYADDAMLVRWPLCKRCAPISAKSLLELAAKLDAAPTAGENT